MMMEAFAGRRYDEPTFCSIFELLAPQALTFRTDNRLVKLDRRQIEYLLLLSAAPFIAITSQKSLNIFPICYSSGAILEVLGRLPEAVFPEKRRKRAYISAALARNERSRNGACNREIFARIKTGYYVSSPFLAWANDDGWDDFFSSLSMKDLKKIAPEEFGKSFDSVMDNLLSARTF